MKILIDIVHSADINFYKYAVEDLVNKGHEVVFTVLKRGNLPKKVQNDFKNFKVVPLGFHGKKIYTKMLFIILREISLFFYLLANTYERVTSFGFYPGFPARIQGIRAIHFHDDKEYKKNFKMTKMFASRFVSLCKLDKKNNNKNKKVRVVNSYKELAYLHPKRFKENKKLTEQLFKSLDVKKEKYIYVRDVANISLNYSENELFNYEDFFKYAQSKGYKIIYDSEIEEKNKKERKYSYAKRITQFNFNNMVVIKKYASLVITSGDTVLRESALIGTPTIYTSDRDMEINKKIFKEGIAFRAKNSQELLKIGKDLLKPNTKEKLRNKAEKFISKSEDMTKIIVEEILN